MRKWEVPWIVPLLHPAAKQQDQQDDELTTLAGSVKGSSAEIHSPAMQMRKTNTEF